MSDVIIVGGGFAGNFLAYKLADKGISVKVFEEHRTIGYPSHCSGLVSRKGLSRLGILQEVLSRGMVLSAHRCLRIRAYNKSRIIQLSGDELFVIDRPSLDRLLFEKAVNRGAEYYLGEKVSAIEKDGYIKIRAKHYKSKIVVDAEGAAKKLARGFVSRLTETIPALQIDVSARSNKKTDGIIDIYFNTPDFFSWIIPIGDNVFRLGVASRWINDKYKFLSDLAKVKLGSFKVINIFGGLVNTGGPLDKFVFGKVALVGDAAGQTKPTTAGGIVWSGISACLLAKVIELNISGYVNMSAYERLWEKLFGSHVLLMSMIRKILYLGNPQMKLNFLLSLLPSVITVSFDYDFQFDLIQKLTMYSRKNH
ncbi:MAG: NAD(P)/FAD-dependent oxidoreductase [Candidatus Korarchaeota archaeon]|nr:NAD(P)/FAD-dependent oxidoreductase [Thermoproteota archaeon]